MSTVNGHQSPALLEALRLYERGFAVVPCDGKKAIVVGWDKRRLTRDELTSKINGVTNIAIALNLSDVIDVECDTPEAETNLQVLFNGEIPATPTWKSKRGRHRLFKRPAGLPSKAKIEVDGVEFRIGNGKGTLSVVPPSVHPDGPRYEWLAGLSLDDVEPAELPASVVERMVGTERETTETGPANESADGDIPEGERNDTLFKLACKLFGAGLTPLAIGAALHAENIARCKPPLPDAEVEAIARSAKNAKPQKTQSNAQILVGIALSKSELWHTPEGVSFATIRQGGHQEHHRVQLKEFREWLSREFWNQKGNVPGGSAMQDAIDVIEGKARFDGPMHPVYLRVARNEEKLFIDLCNEQWQVVEISADGWRVMDNPPVRFRRARGMLPLLAPERGGSVEELRRFVNVTDGQWPLFVGWQIGTFWTIGMHAIMKLLGEQGAAKTTAAKVARGGIDPNTALLRKTPRDTRELMIAASNSWVVAFDNLSYINPELSDSLCSLSSGIGMTVKKNYTDDEEIFLVAKRPIILNGIEDPATRSDLLDRCLIFNLPRIEKYIAEDVFWREYAEAQPRIFGAMLDAVSTALRNLPEVKKRDVNWPRLIDFCQFCTAAEPALGLKQGAFLEAFNANRLEANQTALESSPVANAVLAMLQRVSGFEGTASALLEKLSLGQDTRARSWPKNARVLSGVLNRLAPNLRAAGVVVEKIDDRSWRIKRGADSASAAAKTQDTQNNGPIPPGSKQSRLQANLAKLAEIKRRSPAPKENV